MGRMSLSSVQDSLSVLLPIRPNGDGPILFCVHPAGGLSWGYMSLARYVPENLRLYGLQARALDGTTEFPASLRDMAADYIGQIKTVQPAGPYRLLGYSSGGIVAHEMAVQLREEGEDVAIVVGDTYPPQRSAAEPAGGEGTRARPAGGEDPQARPRANAKSAMSSAPSRQQSCCSWRISSTRAQSSWRPASSAASTGTCSLLVASGGTSALLHGAVGA